MVGLVRQLYELGGLLHRARLHPVTANTNQNTPKPFTKNKFAKSNHPKNDPDCALGVLSASNQHNERRFAFYWGYKSHVLIDCISGLPLYEPTTPAKKADSTDAAGVLDAVNQVIPLRECSFLANKGHDVKSVYNTVKSVYAREASIPLNSRNSKAGKEILRRQPHL